MARGIAAALALGASAVQIGTAYLFCPEAKVSAPHRAALAAATDEDTEVTNLFTGRPARGIVNRLMHEMGPLSPDVPAFPQAAATRWRRSRPRPKRRAPAISAISGRDRRRGWPRRCRRKI